MSRHVVVVGAMALGAKAAGRFKRLEPASRVTLIDRNDLFSYNRCGIPWFVSGDVSDSTALRTAPYQMLRDEAFFKETKGVDVLTGVEAVRIDREAGLLHTRVRTTGATATLGYDKLVLALGATPRMPGIPGETLDGVHVALDLLAAQRVREAVTAGKVHQAVVLGAGFAGLEMAQALADMWSIETTVLDAAPQILSGWLSPVLARMAMRHIQDKGVIVHTGERALEIRGAEGHVCSVRTDKRTLDAQLVIIAPGSIPNAGLAREAGLDVSTRGGIIVNSRMQTSDPDIYAGGGCVELRHLVSGDPVHLPMGSLAVRQGRVIGTNLAGGSARFDGAEGSFAVKLFEKSAAGTGLTLDAALQSGFDAQSVLIVQLDREHFSDGKALITLELIVDRSTRRILGLQGLGSANDALVGRVNALAAMLKFKPTIDDLCTLEMPYTPPLGSAMDILNNLGNLADNVLAGRNPGAGVDVFETLWRDDKADPQPFFLDCREERDARPLKEKFQERWYNIPQGFLAGRQDEIPRDRPVLVICNTGLRTYEAMVMLRHLGFDNALGIQGGLAAITAYGGL